MCAYVGDREGESCHKAISGNACNLNIEKGPRSVSLENLCREIGWLSLCFVLYCVIAFVFINLYIKMEKINSIYINIFKRQIPWNRK